MKSITKLSLLVFMLCSFSVTYAQPSTPAPTPTHNAADVAVIFSDFYTTTLKLEPQNWGKPASIESIATNANDKVLKCTNTMMLALLPIGQHKQKDTFILMYILNLVVFLN